MAKQRSKSGLGAVGAARGASAAPPTVGGEITSHLRALQAQRRDALGVESIVGALVPAISALAGRGMLVSVSVTRDARSVRLSALIEKEWVEWFFDDHEDAGEIGAMIVTFVDP